MSNLLAAILGGAVASLLALIARALAVPSDVRRDDADAAERNEALGTWVVDRHFMLRQQLTGIRNDLASQGQGNAGSLDRALAAAKADALHLYRDEARRARRDVALIRAREGLLHGWWRGFKHLDPPRLTSDAAAEPVLNTWRRAQMEAGGPPQPVPDATKRTLEATIASLTATSP